VAVVTMKQLLEAGVHFGHRTRRWNPKMKPYIYGERKGIYIIDLQKTLKLLDQTYDYVRERAREGATFMFVGTKRQAQQIIENEAKRCGAAYVNNRWLGGLLTNFTTIRKRIEVLKQYEEMEISGELDALPKKEQSRIRKKLEKLRKNLNGVKDMERIPDVIYVVDPKKEEIAVAEANKLGITVIGIADTNCDPDVLDYLVPGNDDAIRAIQLITRTIADAILEGREGMSLSEEAAEVVEETKEEPEEKSVEEEKVVEAEVSEASDDETQNSKEEL